MHRVCSLEIKVHCLDVSALLCSFRPKFNSARSQIQMAPARLNSWRLLSVCPRFKEVLRGSLIQRNFEVIIIGSLKRAWTLCRR